ncbi:MAG: hypothetical protein J5J06_08470 [Phycisphaerae bacterium]|nr:hypothetical protein [Phycisphaerae bacterium]
MSKRTLQIFKWASAAFVTCIVVVGCGGIFNPAFINTTLGGAFPVTPGPEAAFVFVRCVNETGQNAEFIVTIERAVIERDAEGNPLVDDSGNAITRPVRETKRLNAGANAPGNEIGVLFSCRESPVNVVGLGENLLPTDTAVFVGGGTATGTPGTGVPAEGVNPLVRTAGNFGCGDTIIFRIIRRPGVTGNAIIQSFLLPGFEQPSVFTGPNTFVNLQDYLESQTREND